MDTGKIFTYSSRNMSPIKPSNPEIITIGIIFFTLRSPRELAKERIRFKIDTIKIHKKGTVNNELI
jgi:hypothetical protein